MRIIINTDGASRGNPGPASYGYVIKDRAGVILHQEGQTLGVTTNNVAEYQGVLQALNYIKERYLQKSPHEIEVITDSLLIAQQLAGRFRVKNQNLKILYLQIKKLEDELGVIKYRNVPREQNFLADKLANQALDREL